MDIHAILFFSTTTITPNPHLNSPRSSPTSQSPQSPSQPSHPPSQTTPSYKTPASACTPLTAPHSLNSSAQPAPGLPVDQYTPKPGKHYSGIFLFRDRSTLWRRRSRRRASAVWGRARGRRRALAGCSSGWEGRFGGLSSRRSLLWASARLDAARTVSGGIGGGSWLPWPGCRISWCWGRTVLGYIRSTFLVEGSWLRWLLCKQGLDVNDWVRLGALGNIRSWFLLAEAISWEQSPDNTFIS